MRTESRLEYAFAVGRIRALERDLIPKPVFREAAEERDLASALKVVFDAGKFQVEKVDVESTDELDDLLEKEERTLEKTMSEILFEKEIAEVIAKEDRPEEALAIANHLPYPFIAEYFRHTVDLGNLKVFARFKYTGLPRERLESLLMRGGVLEERLLVENFDLSFSEIGEKLHASPYRDVWGKGVDALEERETFVPLERGFEDFLMSYLRRAKYIVFGPEPVFAYALARRREFRLVRLVGAGKVNRVPAEVLKERISETYV